MALVLARCCLVLPALCAGLEAAVAMEQEEEGVSLLQLERKMLLAGARAPGDAAPPGSNTSRELVILHIGKTGGSTIQEFLEPHLLEGRASYARTHARTKELLQQCDPNVDFAFFVRRPLKRYISSWISRYRKGAPLRNHPWTEAETVAFATFETPTALGAALASTDSGRQLDAVDAMQNIGHVQSPFADYFGGLERAKKCLKNFAFVGRVEHFDEDWKRLVDLLRARGALRESLPAPAHADPASANGTWFDLVHQGKPETLEPVDPVHAIEWAIEPGHVNANSDEFEHLNHMDPEAIAATRSWYMEDYEVIKMLVWKHLLPHSYLAELEEDNTPW